MSPAEPTEEERIEGNARRDELARQQAAADIRSVMESPQGRRFVARVIYEFGGLLELAFALDPHQTAFNEGQRAPARHLLLEVARVARGSWALMEAERVERLRDIPVDEHPNKTDQ